MGQMKNAQILVGKPEGEKQLEDQVLT